MAQSSSEKTLSDMRKRYGKLGRKATKGMRGQSAKTKARFKVKG